MKTENILKKKSYSEKLQSPKWQKKRLQILERDEWKCSICGDEESALHVHHKKYTGNPWDASGDDLQTLCKYCHKIIEDFKGDEIVSIKIDVAFHYPDRAYFIAHKLSNGNNLLLIAQVVDGDFSYWPGSISSNTIKRLQSLIDSL